MPWFEKAITQFGVEGAAAHAWLNLRCSGYSRLLPK
jgi:hypothetical protein